MGKTQNIAMQAMPVFSWLEVLWTSKINNFVYKRNFIPGLSSGLFYQATFVSHLLY